MRRDLFKDLVVGGGISILACIAAPIAYGAQVLAVDFNGTGENTGTTQPGFTGVQSNPATVGPYTISESTNAPSSGFYSRSGVTDNPPAFTESALYEDFYYAQNNSFTGNPSATISISGLTPNTPYSITFYTYDASNSIGTGPFVTTFTGVNNTTGTGTPTSYTEPPQTSPGSYTNTSPTFNEEYTSTGIYTSTTGTVDIQAAITSNNDFLRINGFTVSTVPEPTTLSLAGVALTGLLARRRR